MKKKHLFLAAFLAANILTGQGGLDYDKMKFFSRFALKMFVKALKKSKDEKQRGMGAYIDHSYDATDIKYIDPILDFLGTEK